MNKDRTLPKAWESIDSLIIASKNKFNTINDLKVANIIPDTVVETIGKDTITDGLGSKYIIKETDISFDGNNILLNNGMYACEIPDTRVSNILRDEYQIKYQNIGSTTDTIDILEWGKTSSAGFYRSINEANLFDNLPEQHPLFELQVGNIKDNSMYKTIVFKSYDRNYFWINTYNPEKTSWLGWSKILNNNDNILLERPTITTKEQADKLFNTMTNIMTGYTYIASFDTVFAGTSGVKPEVQYGFLYTYVYKADTQKAVYQVYIGFAGNGQYNVSRRGVVQTNGVDIVYSDWKMENQQIQSGGASGRNWLKLADGTLIQYGNISITTNGTNYDANTLLSFPLAFSNTSVYSIICTVAYPNRADKVFVAVNTPNQSNINIRFNQSIGSISATIFWQAIGRWK